MKLHCFNCSSCLPLIFPAADSTPFNQLYLLPYHAAEYVTQVTKSERFSDSRGSFHTKPGICDVFTSWVWLRDVVFPLHQIRSSLCLPAGATLSLNTSFCPCHCLSFTLQITVNVLENGKAFSILLQTCQFRITERSLSVSPLRLSGPPKVTFATAVQTHTWRKITGLRCCWGCLNCRYCSYQLIAASSGPNSCSYCLLSPAVKITPQGQRLILDQGSQI